jgi:hypothetical protein
VVACISTGHFPYEESGVDRAARASNATIRAITMTVNIFILSFAERHGSGDPTPCGGYPAAGCWVSFCPGSCIGIYFSIFLSAFGSAIMRLASTITSNAKMMPGQNR